MSQGSWGQCGKGTRVPGRQRQGPWLSIGSRGSRENRLKARPQQVSLAKVSFYSARLGWSAWVEAGSAFYRRTRAEASNQSKRNNWRKGTSQRTGQQLRKQHRRAWALRLSVLNLSSLPCTRGKRLPYMQPACLRTVALAVYARKVIAA